VTKTFSKRLDKLKPHCPNQTQMKSDTALSFRDRCLGCLTGLVVGDALGTTLEFTSPGSFQPIGDMVGGGPFQLKPGEWTDDTSMALCLASSLVECGGFDAGDQMQRYVRWWKEGYHSSNGRCFDIGGTVRSALQRFLETGDPFSGSTDTWSAGNGSLMRLAPVPIFFASTPAEAIRLAGESSRTTHGESSTIDACRYFAALLLGALSGKDRELLLSSLYSPVSGFWETNPLHPSISEIAAGSFLQKEPPEIRGNGHVVRSLEAAPGHSAEATPFAKEPFSPSTSARMPTPPARSMVNWPAPFTDTMPFRIPGGNASLAKTSSPPSPARFPKGSPDMDNFFSFSAFSLGVGQPLTECFCNTPIQKPNSRF